MRIKLHSGNCVLSREAGYSAANQTIPIEQAKKREQFDPNLHHIF